MSQMNSASFILNGKQVDIAAKDLMSHAKPLFVQEVSPLPCSLPHGRFYLELSYLVWGPRWARAAFVLLTAANYPSPALEKEMLTQPRE